MKEWYSASELAGTPGSPRTKSAVIRRAKRESWRDRPRKGRGGGREYHIQSLPQETRQHLAAEHVNRTRSQAALNGAAEGARAALKHRSTVEQQRRSGAQGLSQLATLQGRPRSRAEARLAVLDAAADYQRASHLSSSKALAAFCADYNMARIEISDKVHEYVPEISPATIYRWRKRMQHQGAAALAGRYGNRRGTGRIDSQPDLREFAEAFLAEYPHTSAKHLHRAMRTRFADSGAALPSRRATERWLTRWKTENKPLYTAISNPDAWKSNYMPAFGSASESIIRANQLWEMDSTPADVMLTDGRHSLIGIIDVATRRARLLVSKTSTAASVASAVRGTLLDWGVPEAVKHDNGSDYDSHHLRRVYELLDIEPKRCTPFAGWEKPHIERFFRTFAHDLVELLPNYIGHNVADRQAIEARKAFADRIMERGATVEIDMSAEELQTFCDRWLRGVYHIEPHSALEGRAPIEAAAGQPVNHIEDERALDVLLATAPGDGTRTVGKKGIRLEGYTYIAPELGDLVGERVLVLYDEHDLGCIHVFADLGEGWSHVCVAECPDITGISRQAVAAAERAIRGRRVQKARADLKRAGKRLKTQEIVEEMLAAGEAQADKIAMLPGRASPYDSQGLRAASDAVEALDRKGQEPDVPPVDQAAVDRVVEMVRNEQRSDEDADDRFRRWILLERCEPDSLTEIERQWKASFENSAEYRGRIRIYEQFGPDTWLGTQKNAQAQGQGSNP